MVQLAVAELHFSEMAFTARIVVDPRCYHRPEPINDFLNVVAIIRVGLNPRFVSPGVSRRQKTTVTEKKNSNKTSRMEQFATVAE